jgi:hypothetical protein
VKTTSQEWTIMMFIASIMLHLFGFLKFLHLTLLFNVLCLNLKIKNMIVLSVFSLVIWYIFTLCLTEDISENLGEFHHCKKKIDKFGESRTHLGELQGSLYKVLFLEIQIKQCKSSNLPHKTWLVSICFSRKLKLVSPENF